jgi:hypothetical protein
MQSHAIATEPGGSSIEPDIQEPRPEMGATMIPLRLSQGTELTSGISGIYFGHNLATNREYNNAKRVGYILGYAL